MAEEVAFSPEHYIKDGFQTAEFVERVLADLDGRVSDAAAWRIGSALMYALHAGKKDDWRVDADKCANLLHRALTGKWLDE